MSVEMDHCAFPRRAHTQRPVVPLYSPEYDSPEGVYTRIVIRSASAALPVEERQPPGGDPVPGESILRAWS